MHGGLSPPGLPACGGALRSPLALASPWATRSRTDLIAILCFFVQNGLAIYDDVNGRQIPGLDEFRGLVDVQEPGATALACGAATRGTCSAGMAGRRRAEGINALVDAFWLEVGAQGRSSLGLLSAAQATPASQRS
jgi:hypothetical protein